MPGNYLPGFVGVYPKYPVGEGGLVRKLPSTDSIGFRSTVLPAACWDASVGAQRAAPVYQDALAG